MTTIVDVYNGRPVFDDIDLTWQHSAIDWSLQNPVIEEMFVGFARQLKAAGRRRSGIKMIVERVRWESAISTKGDKFKLNGAHVSWYSRLLMTKYPDLAGLFEIRRRTP